jgi:hypothetical protein
MTRELRVACTRAPDGWTCEVDVGADAAATHHRVTVSDTTLRELAGEASDPTALVEAAFDFLLEREPRESILRSFELPVIGRYFPGWESDVRARLGG